MTDVWYRYEDKLYASSVDEWGGSSGPGRVEVVLRTYPVLKTTPKGAWLDLGFGHKRFCLRECRKHFACATEEEAKESFRRRKQRQISIYQRRIHDAEEALFQLDGTSTFMRLKFAS